MSACVGPEPAGVVDSFFSRPVFDIENDTKLGLPKSALGPGVKGAIVPWFATTTRRPRTPMLIGALPPELNGEPATCRSAPVRRSTSKTAMLFEPWLTASSRFPFLVSVTCWSPPSVPTDWLAINGAPSPRVRYSRMRAGLSRPFELWPSTRTLFCPAAGWLDSVYTHPAPNAGAGRATTPVHTAA